MRNTRLTVEQVEKEIHKSFSPVTNDFRWHPDGGCTVIPLLWWDDASYMRYQSDEMMA